MWNWKRPSPAFALALFATFVSLSGVGIAATGGTFILGQSNSADATSSLSGGIAAGPMLQMNNTDVGGGLVSRSVIGRGITGQHTGTTGTNPGVDASTASANTGGVALTATNSGGGSAASFTVNNNSIPPFKVNSHGKVAGLNVDSIDGLDKVVEAGNNGLGAIPGKFTSGRQHITTAEGGPLPIITIPGVMNLTGTGGAGCTITFENPASNPSSYIVSKETLQSGGTTFSQGPLPSPGTIAIGFAAGGEVRFQAWVAGDPSTSARVLDVDVSTFRSGTDCEFAATAYQGGG